MSNLKGDFNELTKVWSDCNLNDNVCLLLPFIYKTLTGLKANQHHRNRSTWKNILLSNFLLFFCLLVRSLLQNLTTSEHQSRRAGLFLLETFSYAQFLIKEYIYIFLYDCMFFFSQINIWTKFTNNLVLKDFRESLKIEIIFCMHLTFPPLFLKWRQNRHTHIHTHPPLLILGGIQRPMTWIPATDLHISGPKKWDATYTCSTSEKYNLICFSYRLQ